MYGPLFQEFNFVLYIGFKVLQSARCVRIYYAVLQAPPKKLIRLIQGLFGAKTFYKRDYCTKSLSVATVSQNVLSCSFSLTLFSNSTLNWCVKPCYTFPSTVLTIIKGGPITQRHETTHANPRLEDFHYCISS